MANYDWAFAVADLRGGVPPGGSNSFNFMQFLGKYGKIVCWCPPPPGELVPPPWGNPGSATDLGHFLLDFFGHIWTQGTLRHILGPILVIFEICHFLIIPGPFEYFSENGWSQKIKNKKIK